MPNKKKSSSPIVWHNSLVKPRYNLHQKPERETNYVYALPPHENLHQEPETETKLFLCPSTSSDMDGCAADTSVHIYARGGSFFEFGINGNLG